MNPSRRLRAKNLALGLALAVAVAIVFGITLVRFH